MYHEATGASGMKETIFLLLLLPFFYFIFFMHKRLVPSNGGEHQFFFIFGVSKFEKREKVSCSIKW
jgi:hypothetical protein